MTAPRSRPRRGAYLLPSAFTIGNMLLGFYAVVSGFHGAQTGATDAFQRAALLIFAAAIVDTLDGRIARLTGTESDFGKQLDSLADAATFGLAPALLAYFWGLSRLGRIGWLVPLFYFVCTTTRLARFNVQSRALDSRWFVGLPSPAAAGAICSLLFFSPDREWRTWIDGLMVVSLVTVGALMVSTFRYWSFKRVDLKRRWSYRALLPLAAAILLVALRPKVFFLVAAVCYTASGPLTWLWGRLRTRAPADADAAGDETAEPAGGE